MELKSDEDANDLLHIKSANICVDTNASYADQSSGLEAISSQNSSIWNSDIKSPFDTDISEGGIK